MQKRQRPKRQMNKKKLDGATHVQHPVSLSKDGVVSVKVSEEEMKNLLNAKKASDLTPADDLRFEIGKLRTHLSMWSQQVSFEGKLYLIMVDPLNKIVSFMNSEEEANEKRLEAMSNG